MQHNNSNNRRFTARRSPRAHPAVVAQGGDEGPGGPVAEGPVTGTGTRAAPSGKLQYALANWEMPMVAVRRLNLELHHLAEICFSPSFAGRALVLSISALVQKLCDFLCTRPVVASDASKIAVGVPSGPRPYRRITKSTANLLVRGAWHPNLHGLTLVSLTATLAGYKALVVPAIAERGIGGRRAAWRDHAGRASSAVQGGVSGLKWSQGPRRRTSSTWASCPASSTSPGWSRTAPAPARPKPTTVPPAQIEQLISWMQWRP